MSPAKKNKYEPDILDGDLSYLVGTWEWDSTYHRYNWCTGGATIEEMIYKETDEFKLVFEENGYVTYLANDSLIFKKGFTIDYYDNFNRTPMVNGNSIS